MTSPTSEVFWDTPLDFNPEVHVPPYLRPEAKQLMARVASFRLRLSGTSDLSSVLVYLRALAFLHQTHHWQSQGPTFYADHELFDRMYQTVNDEVDALAEKIVGTQGAGVNPAFQAAKVSEVVQTWTALPFSPAEKSLAAETDFMAVLKAVRHAETFSDGTNNLLDSLADAHETNVYLLRQRCER